MHRHDEAFSTEPIHSNSSSTYDTTNTTEPLIFNNIQELKTNANSAFVHYLQHFPLIFEIFGHLNRSTILNSVKFGTNATLSGYCEPIPTNDILNRADFAINDPHQSIKYFFVHKKNAKNYSKKLALNFFDTKKFCQPNFIFEKCCKRFAKKIAIFNKICNI